MRKITLPIILIILLCQYSCSNCKVENYYFPVEVKHSLVSSEVNMGQKINITINFNNELVESRGSIHDISGEEVDVAIVFQKFTTDINREDSPFKYYKNALNKFNIEVKNGSNSNFHENFFSLSGNERQAAIFLKPDIVESERKIELNITPLEKDTFLIKFSNSLWDSNREMKDCADLNYIKFENRRNYATSTIINQMDDYQATLIEDFPAFDPEEHLFEYDGGIYFIVN